MFKRMFSRVQDNTANTVLPLAILSIVLLLIAIGIALDVTKNTYIKQGYKHIAQKSVQEAVKVIDSQGNIGPDAPARVVQAYMRERNKSEFAVFDSGKCNVVKRGYRVAENNVLKQNVANRRTPYMVITLKNNIRGVQPENVVANVGGSISSVGVNLSSGLFRLANIHTLLPMDNPLLDDLDDLINPAPDLPKPQVKESAYAVYVSEGGGSPRLVAGRWSTGMKVVQAQVYDTADNFLLNIAQVGSEDYNLSCQYFNMNVAATKFGSQKDVIERSF